MSQNGQFNTQICKVMQLGKENSICSIDSNKGNTTFNDLILLNLIIPHLIIAKQTSDTNNISIGSG